VKRLRQGPLVSAALCLLSFLLAAEAFARLWHPAPVLPPVLERPPYSKLILNAGPRGLSFPATHSVNGWGLRGDVPPRHPSQGNAWIALGGSTTLCYCLDDHKTWPYLLQEKLRAREPRTWVGNAGQDGITSAGQDMLMNALAPRLRPKGVILMVGENDLVLNFSDERRERGSPHDAALARRLSALDGGGWRGFLRAHSRLYQLHYDRWLRRQAETSTLDRCPHQAWFPPPLSAPEDALPGNLLVSLPSFKLGLLSLRATAAKLGLRVVFVTQPLLYGSGPEWAGREGRKIEVGKKSYRISAATERKLLDVFNGTLLSFCASEKMECVDLASRVPNDSLYFYDQAHFTEAGAALAAGVLAEYFSAHP
jgi:hypothetical protein